MKRRSLFSDEHLAFRKIVATFVESEIVPHHRAWERDGIVPRELWARAGRHGLLCTAVPEEYGGQGGDFLSSVVVAEELARAGATGPFFHLHSDVVAAYILKYGTEEQKQQWLRGMASGELIGAIAMSEAGRGSDLQRIETRACREDGAWILNGQKVFISNGHLADVVIVAARVAQGSGAEGITLFLVGGDAPGFERGRRLEKIGLHAQDTSELFFSDVRLLDTAVLGGVGEGFKLLMSELPQERLLQAIRSVAAAEAAIEWTIEYASERELFGRRLSSFQNTQFTLAELTAYTAAQRAFVDRCIALHIEETLSNADAAMVKLTAVETHCRVVDECLQLFGGWGYMLDYPIARAYVDARQAKLAGGSIEVMKLIIARSLLDPEGVAAVRSSQ